jgi:hypothetical protein
LGKKTQFPPDITQLIHFQIFKYFSKEGQKQNESYAVYLIFFLPGQNFRGGGLVGDPERMVLRGADVLGRKAFELIGGG